MYSEREEKQQLWGHSTKLPDDYCVVQKYLYVLKTIHLLKLSLNTSIDSP